MPARVKIEGMISVLPGEAGKVDMVERGCSPTWETIEVVVSGLRVDEVMISEIVVE